MSVGESSVMHCEDSTFCAASWPQAMKSAVTMLEACALKPPSAPAIAEPTRFLAAFSSQIAATLVLSTRPTSSPGMVASTTTEQPRPSIQLTAAAFLSQHMFPESPSTCISPNSPTWSSSNTLFTPFETIFIPIASPVRQTKRAYACLPATATRTERSFPKRVVLANHSCARANCSGSSSHVCCQ